MGGAVSAFVVFCVLLLVGLPVALSLPGPAREWTGLAFEALVIGVVVEMLVAIVFLPALGAALVLGGGAFARALRLHIVAAIGIALILLVHPVAVWFSQFPVSEALFAVLLLALLYLVLQTRATGSTAYAVIAGLVVGALLLVRGEAVLLGPILTLLLLASTAVDEESTARVQLQFTFVA